MELSRKIEAVLFWKAEPVSVKKLTSIFRVDEKEINDSLAKLADDLKDRGVTLVVANDEVMLGTHREVSELIAQLTKEELIRDLGKAGYETLSIILYQGPISRADIDYIRGVNSQFILRALLIRGLVERIDNPKDARSYLYVPTLALLSHLGVNKTEDLPEFEKVKKDIESFKQETDGQPHPKN
jgi:segregation and condensation protein B